MSLKSFNPYRPTLSLARETNRQFYCTRLIINNKVDNNFFVSADRQTFLGFEMTANLRDTSPLSLSKQEGRKLRFYMSNRTCLLCSSHGTVKICVRIGGSSKTYNKSNYSYSSNKTQ